MGENMPFDFDQAKLRKGELADPAHHGSHDTTAPVRLRQPVADFRSMRFADLEAVEPAPTNQRPILFPDGPMDRTPLLLRRLFDNLQPFLKIGLGVRIRDTQGAVVN